MNNNAQYLRECSLIIGDNQGNGIELANMHVKFTVHKADTQTPAFANIRVYNLSEDTAKRLQKEFTQVFLQAGYAGNLGLIFTGAVRQYRKGRENATDTFLDIVAQDGDTGYNWALMNTTIATGWNQQSLHESLLQSFDPFGIKTGYVPEFGGPNMPRAKVCYGMTRDYMRTLADGAGTSWHVADGLLNMVPYNSTLPGEAVVLTAKTGLIGLPQQTVDGITVKCLLNPKIKFGGQIKLDNNSIQQQQINIAYSAVNNFIDQATGENTALDNDGFYKVYAVNISGDTRGQDWYSNLICVGVNATAPLSGPYINAVASTGARM